MLALDEFSDFNWHDNAIHGIRIVEGGYLKRSSALRANEHEVDTGERYAKYFI